MSEEFDQSRNDDIEETNPKPPEFDFAKYPNDTLFHDRRGSGERRSTKPREPEAHAARSPAKPSDRRVKMDRRRRIDPTTFEKQYTDDEMEFMNAMQRFKEHSGKSFPSHGDVLKVAAALGYRRVVVDPDECCDSATHEQPTFIHPSTVEA